MRSGEAGSPRKDGTVGIGTWMDQTRNRRARTLRGGGAILLTAVLLAGCSKSESGSAVEASGDGTTDASSTASTSTKAEAAAKEPGVGAFEVPEIRYATAMSRLADALVGAWEIVPEISSTSLPSGAIVGADGLKMLLTPASADAARDKGFEYGYTDARVASKGRENPVEKTKPATGIDAIVPAILVFPDEKAAAKAAEEMSRAGSNGGDKEASIPGSPDAKVTIGSAADKRAVAAYEASGIFVQNVYVSGNSDEKLLEGARKFLELQRPRLKGLEVPHVRKNDEDRKDRMELNAHAPELIEKIYRDPESKTLLMGPMPPRASLHSQDDPIGAAKAYAVGEIDAIAGADATVYRSKTEAATKKFAEDLFESVTLFYKSAEPYDGDLKDARCAKFEHDRPGSNMVRTLCVGTVGKYVVEVSGEDPQKVRRIYENQVNLLR